MGVTDLLEKYYESIICCASLQIHNILNKVVNHKSMVMAAPPGQFIALQALNALEDTILG